MGNRKYCKVRNEGRKMVGKCVMAKDRKEASEKLKGVKGKIVEANFK